MTRVYSCLHEFVTTPPDNLDEGKIYVSIKFATAAHKCMCGCGCEVITPIRPTDWHLTFDGETVSLHPSLGNWGFPCQSHYFIKNNSVIWAGVMSKAAIDRGRTFDAMSKERYFNAPTASPPPPSQIAVIPKDEPKAEKVGFLAAIVRWILG